MKSTFVDRESDQAKAIEAIKATVAECYGCTREQLEGPWRHRRICHPRMLAMYLARRLTDASLPDIGAHFGMRDHSTVLFAVRQAESRHTAIAAEFAP